MSVEASAPAELELLLAGGERSTRSSRGRAEAPGVSASLPTAPCIRQQPLGQASLGALGSGAKEEASNWVCSGWEIGRKETCKRRVLEPTAARAKAGPARESPVPAGPPGSAGVAVAEPVPRGWGHHTSTGIPPANGVGRPPLPTLTFKCSSPVHFHSALILPFFSFIYIAICSLSFHLSPGESCQNLTTER